MAKFKPVSAERFSDMLDIVPPALQTSVGFLLGEAMGTRECEVTGVAQTTLAAFVQMDGLYFEAVAPMTVPEFRKLTAQAVLTGTD